jgi:type VI secretion system protein ImpH
VAGEDRRADHPLIRRLEREARQFSFFQAVRLLQRASAEAVPVGYRGPANAEAVRLRPTSSMAFQSADVLRVERREADGPAHKLTCTLVGLYGASSGLPAYYSEDILGYETQNAPDLDPARLFLDVLNHRLLSLLYRSWEKYRWAFRFEADAADQISREMLALLGIGTEAVERAVGVPAARLLRYAGFITQRPKGAVSLAGVLSDYFGGPQVQISECVLRWVTLPERDRCRLGQSNSTLSSDLVLGESVQDEGGKFRIHLGPFEADPRFESFLPDTQNAADLGALVRLLVPDPLDYDVELRIRGPHVPEPRIASDDSAARLGWTCWLLSESALDKTEIFPAPPLRRAA